jgi:hypothetical protein
MSSDDTTRIIRPNANYIADGPTETKIIKGKSIVKKSYHDEEATRIFRPKPVTSSKENTDTLENFYKDPLVGWLVVVSGPGKGTSIELGYGFNSIGRDKDQRVCLDFGDEQISRRSHAAIVFDQKSRRFFIQHADGINLTYLNDDPVLQSSALIGHECISIGRTKLVFVPLCGQEFDWTNYE